MRTQQVESFGDSLGESLESIAPYAGLTLAVLSALSFAQGSHIASYIFLVVADLFLAGFILRWFAHKELERDLLLVGLSIAVFAWLGFNLLKDYREGQGVVVAPARNGETLILLTQFDKRGTREIDLSRRIHARLKAEIERRALPNVRLEIVDTSRVRVGDRTAARRLGQQHRATFVIWGWYDDLDVHPDFVIVPDGSPGQDLPRLTELSTTEVDTAFLIREGLPDELSYMALFVVGQLLIRQDRLDEARDAFDVAEDNARAAKVSSGIGSLYFQRAIVLHWLGSDLNLVVDEYTRAIEKSPSLAPAYYYRSLARTARADAPALIFADYARAVELDPRLIPFAYFSTRDLPTPLPHSSLALSKVREGLRAYALGDFDQTIDLLTEAIAAAEAYDVSYYFRARAHHVRGDLRLALADYTRFLDTTRSYPPLYAAYTHYARALAHRSLNMPNLAAEDFDLFLKLAPLDDPFRTPAEYYRQNLANKK